MLNWSIDTQDAQVVVDLFERAAEVCRTDRYRVASTVRLPREGILVATGDLHDNPLHLDRILRFTNLAASEHRHVIFHELIHGENLVNGMDFSHRMLIHLADLMIRYPNQIHPLLANHELAQLMGLGVTKGAGDSVKLFWEAVEYVFGEESESVRIAIGEFIRSWPIALITESGILCAHSLPSEFAMKAFDTNLLNRDLTEEDYAARTGSAYLMVWGRRHSADHLDMLAELFGVTMFCLGHEHAESGYHPVGRRGIILNSDHERGAILPIDLSAEPVRDDLLWAIRPVSGLA